MCVDSELSLNEIWYIVVWICVFINTYSIHPIQWVSTHLHAQLTTSKIKSFLIDISPSKPAVLAGVALSQRPRQICWWRQQVDEGMRSECVKYADRAPCLRKCQTQVHQHNDYIHSSHRIRFQMHWVILNQSKVFYLHLSLHFMCRESEKDGEDVNSAKHLCRQKQGTQIKRRKQKAGTERLFGISKFVFYWCLRYVM